MKNSSPLHAVQVIDLSNAGPGPRCSRVLADLGAQVTRISPPRAREIEVGFHGYSAGRGWKKLGLDLKTEQGRKLLLDLVRTADVFIEGFRPGVAGRLGIRYEDLTKIKPDLIYCSLSGYGQDGPGARRVGHDINYAATGGMYAAAKRNADGEPILAGLTVADAAAGGLQAAVVILAALLRRQSSGAGAFLDISVSDGVLQLMSLFVDEYLATGVEPAPGGSVLTGRYACYGFYRARDARWISVGAIESTFFETLCIAVGCEDWIKHQYDDSSQPAIREALQKAFATRDRDEWMRILGPLDTCVAPVNSIAELASEATFVERGLFREINHPEHGRFPQVGNIFGRMFGSDELPAELSDANKILGDLGMDRDTIRNLRDAGIVS